MINIKFPDNSVKKFKPGVSSLEIAKSISPGLAREVYASTVNGYLRDLTRPVNEESSIVFHKWEDREAKHTFWHTSAHLMASALEELYPGIKFGIGPSVENGFYYDVDPGDGIVISEAGLSVIEDKMRELAKKNNSVERIEISMA